MKLKYYLRGLGIGIVVTAIIMTIALGNKQPMTDEEVLARAKELGMIENIMLKDLGNKEIENNDNESDAVIKEENPEKPTEDVKEEVKEEIQEEPAEEPVQEQKEENVEKDENPTAENNEIITVSVVSGDSSWSVAKRMEEAGLVESAKEFDQYLCQNGYDKRISVGTYEISQTATLEEMAKKITKSE